MTMAYGFILYLTKYSAQIFFVKLQEWLKLQDHPILFHKLSYLKFGTIWKITQLVSDEIFQEEEGRPRTHNTSWGGSMFWNFNPPPLYRAPFEKIVQKPKNFFWKLLFMRQIQRTPPPKKNGDEVCRYVCLNKCLFYAKESAIVHVHLTHYFKEVYHSLTDNRS